MIMKKQIKRTVISVSKCIAYMAANSTCIALAYQDKVPQTLKKLRRF